MAIETEFNELVGEQTATRAVRQAVARPMLRASSIYLLVTYAVLVVAGFVAMVPFLYVISTSLKETIALFHYPPEWIPHEPTLVNYKDLIREHPWLRWTLNSFIVAASVTVIKVVIDSMAGYAFAKMRFPGKDALFLLVLLTLMVPFAATLLPLYIIVRELHLTNNYLGLILPPLASPIGIFMMRSFIESLPNDLENAARLDGCSELQVYRRVILPLIRPGLVVLGVFTFMNQWTSYLWPLVIGTKAEMFTLTVGVQSLRSLFTVNWGILSAGAVMSMLPLVIVFIFLQRYFIAGSIAGALKE
ncbi:MAG: multiple sugar transport system permease protein [Thermomicrobiales bacterium]|nr:multiple sugar transport system permease protein [Thermomicrobiales bacterium]